MYSCISDVFKEYASLSTDISTFYKYFRFINSIIDVINEAVSSTIPFVFDFFNN